METVCFALGIGAPMLSHGGPPHWRHGRSFVTALWGYPRGAHRRVGSISWRKQTPAHCCRTAPARLPPSTRLQREGRAGARIAAACAPSGAPLPRSAPPRLPAARAVAMAPYDRQRQAPPDVAAGDGGGRAGPGSATEQTFYTN